MKLPHHFTGLDWTTAPRLAANLRGARALVADSASDTLAAQATAEALPGNQFAAVAAHVFQGFEASAHRFLAAAAVTAAQAEGERGSERELESLDADQRSADEHVHLYGPPQVYRRCSFDNYEVTTEAQARALNVARWFTQGSPDGSVPKAQTLVLAGPPGTGKTHLAAAAYLAGVTPRDYYRFGWIAAPRLLRLLQGAKVDYLGKLLNHFGNGEPDLEEDEAGNYDRDLFGAQFLVIDEVGAGSFGAGAIELLAELLDLRILKGLTTIITTNANRAELSDYLGARCLSRLRWRGIWCPLVGEDHRQLPAPAWIDAPPPELPQIVDRRAALTAYLDDARDRVASLRAEALASLVRAATLRTGNGPNATASPSDEDTKAPEITAALVSERTVAAARKHKAEVVRILAGYGATRGSDLKPEQWAPYLEELDALEGKACPLSPLEQLAQLEAAS